MNLVYGIVKISDFSRPISGPFELVGFRAENTAYPIKKSALNAGILGPGIGLETSEYSICFARKTISAKS